MLFYNALPSRPHWSLLEGVNRRVPLDHERSPSPHPGQINANADSFEEQLHETLTTIVRETVSGRKPAVLVTGGLDSAVIAAVAAQAIGEPPLLLTIRAGLTSPRENRLQDQLARTLNADLLVLDELPDFTLEPLIRRNRDSDFPAGGVFTHIWERIADVAFDAGAQILLTGEGGNDLFSPGVALAADLARKAPWQALVVLGRTRDANASMLRHIRDQVQHTYLSKVIDQATLVSTPSSDAARRRDAADIQKWLGAYRSEGPAAATRRVDQIRSLRRHGLTHRAIDARIALERIELYTAGDTTAGPVLAPLCHPQIRELLSRVDPRFIAPTRTGNQDKHLLHRMARRYLPASISEERKIGISNQLSVIIPQEDLAPLLEPLQAGWRWLGLEIDHTFASPEHLSTSTGLLWTKLLAMGAWGLNAHAPHNDTVLGR